MWMVKSAGDPSLILTQPSAYTEVEIAQDACPDPRTTRGQATTPFIRAATAPEIADYDLAIEDAFTDKYYKDPDVLARCYLMLEIEQGQAAWGAKTAGARRTETLARAVRYQQARRFISRNYALFAFPV